MDKEFWTSRYKSDPSIPIEESSFAGFASSYMNRNNGLVLDLGCGNGRDSNFFAGLGLPTLAIDQSLLDKVTLTQNIHAKIESSLTYIKEDYTQIDFNKYTRPGRILYIYSRFSLHAINYEEEARFTQNLKSLPSGSRFFLEARTIRDSLYGVGKKIGEHEYLTDHYRRFIDPIAFLDNTMDSFRALFFEESKGWSKTLKEDPTLVRMILEKL